MATTPIRTDTVERFTGDLTKKNAFLLRFDGKARSHKHQQVYDGHITVRAQAEIDALSTAAEKEAAQALRDKAADDHDRAYQFVIDSLDDEHATIIADYVEIRDPVAAYNQMMKMLRDTSGVTTMTMIWELLNTRAKETGDAATVLRKQVELGTRLRQAKCPLPDEFMKCIALFTLPSDLEHLRHKYLGAADNTGAPQTYKALREALEMEFQAASSDIGVTSGAHRLAEAQKQNDEMRERMQQLEQQMATMRCQPAHALTNEQQGTDKSKHKCSHCGKMYHLASGCWRLHPELNPNRKPQPATPANTVTCLPFAELACAIKASGPGLVVDSGCGVTTLTSTAGCTNIRDAVNRWVEDAGLRKHRVTYLADWSAMARLESGEDHLLEIPNCLICPPLGLDLLSTNHLNDLGYTVILGPETLGQGKTMVTPDSMRMPLAKAGSLPFLPMKAVDTAFSNKQCALPSGTGHARLMHVAQQLPSKLVWGIGKTLV